MNLLHMVYVYMIAVPVFFVIDMVWLGVVAPSLYRSHLGHLLADTVNWPVAIVFYLLFLVGLCFFAIVPALEAGSLARALLLGALFGFFTYATYDLTNWATLRDWPMLISIIDIAWGTVLSATVAAATFLIASATGLR